MISHDLYDAFYKAATTIGAADPSSPGKAALATAASAAFSSFSELWDILPTAERLAPKPIARIFTDGVALEASKAPPSPRDLARAAALMAARACTAIASLGVTSAEASEMLALAAASAYDQAAADHLDQVLERAFSRIQPVDPDQPKDLINESFRTD